MEFYVRKTITMRKYIVFICIAVTFLLTSCSTDESVDDGEIDYVALINSADFEFQVEVLPRLLEYEKFAEVFPSEVHGEDELDRIHDDILLQYLVALMEIDEDELLRNNVVEVFRSFRLGNTPAVELFLINYDYFEKLEIIIPEMTYAYNEIAEERFWARSLLGNTLWFLLFRYNNLIAPEWLL